MPVTQYLIALGSNRRHVRYGSPRRVIKNCFDVLAARGLRIISKSRIIETDPVGPSRRRYANAAALIETVDEPDALMAILQLVESEFGIRRGQRWSARTLDLDIILWSGGSYTFANPSLVIPHISMRERAFVLLPAAEIVPDWRDPLTRLSLRQLAVRKKAGKNAPKPLDRNPKHH